MKKSIIYSLGLLALGLSACQQSFENDSPLYPTQTQSAFTTLAYLKAGDYDYATALKQQVVGMHGDDLAVLPDQEVYVYLSKPAAEDVTLRLELDHSTEALAAYTKGLTTNPGYQLAPEGYAQLEGQEVTIPKGQTKSAKPVLIKAGPKYAEISRAKGESEYFLVALKLQQPQASSVGLSQEHHQLYLPVYKRYANVLLDQQQAKGTAIPSSELTYAVSSSFTGYGPEYMHDGQLSTFWYASFSDYEPWFSVSLREGKRRLTGVRIRPLASYFLSARELTVYTTQDGETWQPQGVIEGYEINQHPDNVVHFLSPIEAKGVKLVTTRRGLSRQFSIKELDLYAE